MNIQNHLPFKNWLLKKMIIVIGHLLLKGPVCYHKLKKLFVCILWLLFHHLSTIMVTFQIFFNFHSMVFWSCFVYLFSLLFYSSLSCLFSLGLEIVLQLQVCCWYSGYAVIITFMYLLLSSLLKKKGLGLGFFLDRVPCCDDEEKSSHWPDKSSHFGPSE